MTQRIKIGTHNGLFHADDVFSVAIATEFFVETRGDDVVIDVVRSRDEEKLAECNMVFDVGGISDGNKFFDHHQRDFQETRDGVPYASAGLAWRAMGKVLCGGDQEVADAVDRDLLQAVDAADNGMALFEGGKPVFEHARSVSVSAAIAAFNPGWQNQSKALFDSQFEKAVQAARSVLKGFVTKALGSKQARRLFSDAEQARRERGDHVVILDKFCPWTEHVDRLDADAYYVVFPGSSGGWMLQCIPPKAGSFEKRVPLPEAWAGMREEDLVQTSGISDATFCHPGRFIAGAKSRDGALSMAKAAFKQQRQDEQLEAANALAETMKSLSDQAG